jgi:hypothetical protein
VAEYDPTALRRSAALRADPTAEPAAAPPAALPPAPTPLVPPAGFRIAASSEGWAGAALVGQVVLYRWPVCRASALRSAVVPSLLDAASHCLTGGWVLLRRVPR